MNSSYLKYTGISDFQHFRPHVPIVTFLEGLRRRAPVGAGYYNTNFHNAYLEIAQAWCFRSKQYGQVGKSPNKRIESAEIFLDPENRLMKVICDMTWLWIGLQHSLIVFKTLAHLAYLKGEPNFVLTCIMLIVFLSTGAVFEVIIDTIDTIDTMLFTTILPL